MEEKYPTDPAAATPLIFQTHHFEISQTSGDTTVKIDIGTTDTTSDFSATAVSNYDYEENVRNEQSQIRLLDPSYLPLFVEEFENLMQESIV